MCSHSKVDEAEGLLQRWLFGVLVVGVSLFIKLCDVLHHLKTQTKLTLLSINKECVHTCERQKGRVSYPVAVGKTPDPGSHFCSEDEKQEEEELNRKTRRFGV